MTAAGGPRIDGYDWAGGRETMLRFGPEHGPTVVVALPLLEEANRTRALAGGILRELASRGIAGALPELPGMGESMVATADLRLADLRAAFAAAVGTCGVPVVSLAIRSGALYSSLTPARGRGDGKGWQLSPQTGTEVAREWRRLRDAGDGQTVAGNRIGADLWAELMEAEPPPARVVRLAGDPRPADMVVEGSPPWRRAEPDGDPALAARLADDLAHWIAACAA